MRAARFHGRGDIRVEEVPDPQVGPGQVEVAVDGLLCELEPGRQALDDRDEARPVRLARSREAKCDHATTLSGASSRPGPDPLRSRLTVRRSGRLRSTYVPIRP